MKQTFTHPYALLNQAHFSLVAVFHESVEYNRIYMLPFNMLGICLRSEGDNASVSTNLKNGEIHDCRENEIGFVPCNLPMQYHQTLRSERYGIHFKLELYPGVDVFSGCEHRINEKSPELRYEAERIFAVKDPVLMLSMCREFALRFCHRHWPAHYALNMEKIKPFEALLHHIKNSADATMTISELAAMMHRSEGCFSREFHAVFKQTPKSFLQKELFKKATQLLLSPDENVKSVATKLNFSSEFYFSKFFKRFSGISPSEYRNSSIFIRK